MLLHRVHFLDVCLINQFIELLSKFSHKISRISSISKISKISTSLRGACISAISILFLCISWRNIFCLISNIQVQSLDSKRIFYQSIKILAEDAIIGTKNRHQQSQILNLIFSVLMHSIEARRKQKYQLKMLMAKNSFKVNDSSIYAI